MASLRHGDLPPHIVTAPPGPRARALSAQLAEVEAPGINTLVGKNGQNILWQEACGANVLDVDGNRYLDLTAGFGVAAIGHRHPQVVAAVRRQSGLLMHALGDAIGHPLRPQLAAALTRWVPVDDPQIYFAISGADAVEIAIKSALLATGRPGLLVFEPSYHGMTLGALAATSRPAFRHPFRAHLHACTRRLPFGCPPREVAAALRADASLGAVLLEPVVGREGVLLPPAGWLAELAALCRSAGVLFIADEIFTGFGRTGTRFAVDAEGVRPDLVCCGKALGGGMPIAAVAGRRAIMSAWTVPHEPIHTATFVAHPVACAAALATLDVLESASLSARAARLGESIDARLQRWPQRFPSVVATRGRGLLWGIESSGRHHADALVKRARKLGLLLLAGGPAGKATQIVPPLTITAQQLDVALRILETILSDLDAQPC